jgi:hypothetical protein
MTNGNCRLCLKKNIDLVKSHIYPKSLFRDLKGEKGNEKIVQIRPFDNIKSKKMSDNFYEEGLLCQSCENIIGVYEKYIESFLFKKVESDENIIENTKEFSIIHLENIDYKLYKLGLLSILWRSSITNHSHYKIVNLGEKHSENIRLMILQGNCKEVYHYPILTSIMDTKKDLINTILPIEKSNSNGITQYTFYLNKFGFYFMIGSNEKMNTLKFTDFIPNSSGNLRIIKHKENYMKNLFESYLFNNKSLRPKYSK